MAMCEATTQKKIQSHVQLSTYFSRYLMQMCTKCKLIGLILINEYICNRPCSDNIWCIIKHIILAAGDEILLCLTKVRLKFTKSSFVLFPVFQWLTSSHT